MSHRLPPAGYRRVLAASAFLLLGGCAIEEGVAVAPPLTLAAEGAATPTTAHDARSRVSFVAWVQRDGEASNVYLARVGPRGERLGVPVRVNASPGDASNHEQAPAQVAVGPRGEVYVAWQKSRPIAGRRHPASDLRLARSTDGGRSFGPTIDVNDDAGGLPASHSFHDLAVGRDGTVYVAWLDSRERDRLRAAWIAAGRLKPATGSGHGGGGHAAEAGLPGSEIRVAALRPGETDFGPSVVVDGGVCPCCRTSLAVAEDGAVYVAWRKILPGEVRDIAIARSDDGARSFTPARVVHRDGWVFPGCPHAGPTVAVDRRGAVHVAWYTGREGRQGLFHASSADRGQSFAAPVALLQDDYVPPSQVRLAAGASGVWAAWDDRRAESREVRVAIVDGTRVVPVAAAIAGHSPSLATTRQAVTLVWEERGAVRTRTFER